MLQNYIFESSKVVNLRAPVLLLRDHGTLTPVAFCPAALIGCDGSRVDYFPLQRSACDYAEVSLSLCICHRLPQVASLILTYPLYRSLPGWKVMARSKSTWLGILTPIQGTYPMVQYSVVSVRRRSYIFPFTTTGQRP